MTYLCVATHCGSAIADSAQVLLYMLDGLLTPANTSSVEALEKVFVFCMIWAMGSALTVADDGTDYQKIFSDWWRSEWKKVSAVVDCAHLTLHSLA